MLHPQINANIINPLTTDNAVQINQLTNCNH